MIWYRKPVGGIYISKEKNFEKVLKFNFKSASNKTYSYTYNSFINLKSIYVYPKSLKFLLVFNNNGFV